jgi:hypothetical protein
VPTKSLKYIVYWSVELLMLSHWSCWQNRACAHSVELGWTRSYKPLKSNGFNAALGVFYSPKTGVLTGPLVSSVCRFAKLLNGLCANLQRLIEVEAGIVQILFKYFSNVFRNAFQTPLETLLTVFSASLPSTRYIQLCECASVTTSLWIISDTVFNTQETLIQLWSLLRYTRNFSAPAAAILYTA